MRTTVVPWLAVRNSVKAVRFYQKAFDAIEVYRFEESGNDVVARLSIEGAEFWLSEESPANLGPESLGGGSVRMILTIADPETLFSKALEAGATEIFPIGVEHGWKIGRLVDPFGHHWEIGHQITR
jgi:PhnB protein